MTNVIELNNENNVCERKLIAKVSVTNNLRQRKKPWLNQQTRTTITSRMSSNFGQVRPQIAELADLERLEKYP